MSLFLSANELVFLNVKEFDFEKALFMRAILTYAENNAIICAVQS